MSATFAHSSIRRSRTERVCDICKQTIPAGAEYERYTGRHKKQWFALCHCKTCTKLISAYVRANHRPDYCAEDIESWLVSTFCDGCMAKAHGNCNVETVFQCPVVQHIHQDGTIRKTSVHKLYPSPDASICCSNCGKQETIRECDIETVIDRGWGSCGSALYCPECTRTWADRNGTRLMADRINTMLNMSKLFN